MTATFADTKSVQRFARTAPPITICQYFARYYHKEAFKVTQGVYIVFIGITPIIFYSYIECVVVWALCFLQVLRRLRTLGWLHQYLLLQQAGSIESIVRLFGLLDSGIFHVSITTRKS
jgi:hypothetical protein